MAASVKVTGGNRWKGKLEQLAKTCKGGILVGVLSGATYAKGDSVGASVAEVMAAHEFGAPGIPARRPLRSGVDKHAKHWSAQFKAVYASRHDAKDAFIAVGDLAAKQIQRGFEEGLKPPLSKKTIERKTAMGYGANASLPLVLTGTMMKAVAFEWVDNLEAELKK